MLYMTLNKSHPESGNVLIYILIAVVLFAALSYAFTQTTSGTSTSSMDSSRNRVQASQVIDYASDIKQAISKIKLLNDCEPEDISFDYLSGNEVLSSDYAHGASNDCKVFHNSGGGMSYSKPQEQWLNKGKSGNNGYQDWIFAEQGHQNIGSGTHELTMHIRYLGQELCTTINDELDINNPGGDPPSSNGDVSPGSLFTGSYSSGNSVGLDGKKTACVDEGSNNYTFYKVLIVQ